MWPFDNLGITGEGEACCLGFIAFIIIIIAIAVAWNWLEAMSKQGG